ncbi:hypothetical protein LTR99_002391 [Exophiala xenobiotica]|uniref:Uncharacterized protein n=1 Tax=Vermiconidia calcicola TaxID=1690605 RepID=A0AAV9QGW4_9PEZI|nr:hypothetical protein LTR99_002391 [Exophiala xenobiotica]KAK5434040.1 hypothetical protein LTR34_003552 [Exophiala xenobiotica]KAK5541536.1 hypothetical protein LTR23_005858 [Chaetothyriales sp. CCFEE 6169]KAK5542272.1 hypothetical protein LTR25_002157 [Vermiconidia calcicola]
MSRLPNAPFTPPVEQRDGTIQFNSNQPTIRIVRETRNTFRYLVYMGQAHESHADNDLVWARLQVAAGRGSSISFYVGPGRSRITTAEFFEDKYTLAFWLNRLMETLQARRFVHFDTWEQEKVFLHDVLHVVLEECTGDELKSVERPHQRTSQVESEAESTEFSQLVKTHIGIEDGTGLRARYYSPFYPTKNYPLQAVVVDNDEGAEQGVPAAREFQPVQKKRGRKPADDTIEEVKGQAGDVNDGSVNCSGGQESDQVAANDINADRVDKKSIRLKHSPSQISISEQEHTNNSDNPRGQGAEKVAASNEPTGVPSIALNYMDVPEVNASWADEIKRLIIQPAKEKALSTIEKHLGEYCEGMISHETIESNIRASLADIRLAGQMQDTLIQSKQNTTVDPDQDPIFENARKRRADPDDDTARSSKAVRGNGEFGGK